jgi:hypothetical protein
LTELFFSATLVIIKIEMIKMNTRVCFVLSLACLLDAGRVLAA